LQQEGWCDPWLLLAALKAKAAELGTQFVTGEAVGFAWNTNVRPNVTGTYEKRHALRDVHVRTSDGRIYPVQFAICVNCAGTNSREIARLAGIGGGEEALGYELPIAPR